MTPTHEAERIVQEWLDQFTYRPELSIAAKLLLIESITTALTQARAEERERAAKVAEEWTPCNAVIGQVGEVVAITIRGIAAAIRSEGHA